MAQKKKKKEPEYLRSAINTRALNYKIYVAHGSENLLHFALLFLAGGLVSMVFYSGFFKADGQATIATWISDAVIFIAAGLVVNVTFRKTVLKALRNRRLKKLKNEFSAFLSSLSDSLSGGMNAASAIANSREDLVSQFSEDSCMVREVDLMLDCIRNNVPLTEALVNFGERSGVNDIRNFAIVFATCQRTGGNQKDVIRRTADVINEKNVINSEIETTLTSNKLQMYAMDVIPIFLVLLMRCMSSDFNAGFTTWIGAVASTVGIGLFVSAFLLGQKIMDIKG